MYGLAVRLAGCIQHHLMIVNDYGQEHYLVISNVQTVLNQYFKHWMEPSTSMSWVNYVEYMANTSTNQKQLKSLREERNRLRKVIWDSWGESGRDFRLWSEEVIALDKRLDTLR